MQREPESEQLVTKQNSKCLPDVGEPGPERENTTSIEQRIYLLDLRRRQKDNEELEMANEPLEQSSRH